MARDPMLTLLDSLGAVAARPWRRQPQETATSSLKTEDGWTLQLRHLPATGAQRRGPVLLQHGLASNSTVFDWHKRSLARAFAAQGFDCWISELRGRPSSIAPADAVPFAWGIEEYLAQDLPAIVAHILEASKRDRLAWVGHSMGGVLMFLYGLRHGCEELACGLTIGSAMDYRIGNSDFRKLRPFREQLRRLPYLPLKGLAQLATPMVGRFGLRSVNAFETFNVEPSNIEGRETRRLFANAFEKLSPRVLEELGETFEEGGFKDRDGQSYLERIGEFTAPVLAIAGSADPQVSPSAVSATVQQLGSRTKDYLLFGKAQGYRRNYGHFDLIVGRRAQQEVWPKLSAFLEKHL